MTRGQWSLTEVDAQAYESVLTGAGCILPIEQTPRWADLGAMDPDREPLGFFLVHDEEGRMRAGFTATRVSDHWASFVWLRHGPVWVDPPTGDDEDRLVEALRIGLAEAAPRATHVRLDLAHPVDGALIPSSMITYDRTVVLDTSRDPEADEDAAAEAILATFKARGRRDVRKSVRESGVECADETARAVRDFSEYHALMAQTAQRDGFIPWDGDYYRRMVEVLGADNCRVYAGRIDGGLVCWSIVTISGPRAWRYYAASATEMMRKRVTDRLILFECLDLGGMGVTGYDLMGIGSDIAPSLSGLNEFKTKFSKDVVEVAPTREIVLRPVAYRALQGARALIRRIRGGSGD